MFTSLRRVLGLPATAHTGKNSTRKALPPRRLELEGLEQRLVLSPISDKYWALGGPYGFEGYPTTPERIAPDGVGHYQYFQGGSIYWSPATGAHEVHGAILGEWGSLGWERSFLGYPTSDETGTAGNGRYNSFQGGYILWSAATGAHEVHGAILGEYAAIGWQTSALGFPVTDETGTPDGVGRYNHFQYGSIYWTPSTGAHEIHGAIRQEWASIGWERSVLGYPTSDEKGTDQSGRYNSFQHGFIMWSAATGAHEIHGAILSEYAALGWQDSVLGFPVTDETGTPDGYGRFNHFQGGTIYWAPWMGTYDLFIHDRALAAVEQAYSWYGCVGRNDMLAVFGQVEGHGWVSPTDYRDLQAIVAIPSFVMPAYLRNLSNKVINGNAANANYLGSYLGNLYAGSPAWRLTDLVNKWFLGADHPDAGTYTYQLASGTMFGGGVNGTLDVDQGADADCYFIAALGEVAYRTPSAISNMFIDNGDNTWTVRFYNGTTPDYVTVDNYYPANGSGYFIFDNSAYRLSDSSDKLWVAAAEKAYAQIAEEGWTRGTGTNMANSYASINYGDPQNTLREITGLATSGHNLTDVTIFGIHFDELALSGAFNDGKLVCLCTPQSPADANVVGNHCYFLTYANPDSDLFILVNPWGLGASQPGILYLSWSQVAANFNYWAATN